MISFSSNGERHEIKFRNVEYLIVDLKEGIPGSILSKFTSI